MPPPTDTPLHTTEDLLKTKRSPLLSHLQTSTDKAKRKPPENSLDAFLSTTGSWFNWVYHYLKSRFGPRYHSRTYPVNGNTGVYKLFTDDEPIRFGIAADWGSYSHESDLVMRELRKSDPHYTLHLGDVYYTGTPDEVRDNFTGPDPCWHYGSKGTYVLPGNHEMYCNGKGFFVTLLHLLKKQYNNSDQVQASSYFCLENKYWRIIGLDTGEHSVSIPGIEAIWPPDTYIDAKAIRWLKKFVFNDPADRRGIIILSHHQIATAFDTAYPRPAQQLAEVMDDAKRDVIWLWGHEHRMAVYDKRAVSADSVAAWGRCIGHGGMPVENKQPDPKRAKENKLLYYDDRVYKKAGHESLGYNGFLNMEMNGPKIDLSYIDLNGTVLMREEFTIDAQHQIRNEILA
jgi:hypothetical protein